MNLKSCIVLALTLGSALFLSGCTTVVEEPVTTSTTTTEETRAITPLGTGTSQTTTTITR